MYYDLNIIYYDSKYILLVRVQCDSEFIPIQMDYSEIVAVRFKGFHWLTLLAL